MADPTRVTQGVVEYIAGAESATYSVTMPGTVQVGDVLVATLEAASNAYGITARPSGDRVVISGLASTGSHYHGGVFAVAVTSASQVFTWTWAAAVRGSLSWFVVRNTTVAAIVGDTSGFTTDYIAPSINAPAGSLIFAGISMGSGSATGTWPSGWTQFNDPTQRQGLIATRGIQTVAGGTGTVQWTAEPNASGRAWQLAIPPADGGGTPEPGTAMEGVVEYPAGAESAVYSMVTPSTAQAGDVLLATLESASNDFGITIAPGSSRLLVSGQNNPGSNHYHGGVWAVTVTGPSQTISWTWAGPVRGSLAWVLIRGTTKEAAVVAVSDWTTGGIVDVWAPALSGVAANSIMFIGVSQGSGSATASAPGWSTVVDAEQRNGTILTRGVDLGGGAMSTVLVTTSSSSSKRAWHVAFPSSVAPPSATEKGIIQGIPTATRHQASYWTAGVQAVRLAAKNSPSGSPLHLGPWATVDADGWSKPYVEGLTPEASYYFQPQFNVGSTTEVGVTQGPITMAPLPMTPTSFEFAFGGDNQDTTGNTSIAYTNLAAHDDNVRFLISTGDTNDGDNTSTSVASHRKDWEDLFTLYPGFKSTVARMPFAQNFGDHDQGGGNNSAPGVWTAPNLAAYQQVFSYPTSPMLPNNAAWSFGWGRVRFIGMDLYHQRTATYKASPAQMAWLEQELNQPEPLKVIFLSAVWYDGSEPEGWPEGDGWADYPDQRTSIVGLIEASKTAGHTQEVLGVHGDQHALSAMSGPGNPYGGFPVIGGSPFSGYASHKGDLVPDSGRWPTSPDSVVHQHGVVSIQDNGDAGMLVTFKGYDDTNAVRVQLTFPVGDYTAPQAIPGADGGEVESPIWRWSKSPSRVVWWDVDAGIWRAILPTASGHRLYDLSSNTTPVQGQVIDSRLDARVTVFHRAGTTYVLRSHSSGALLNVYGPGFSSTLMNVPVPLSATDHDASPVALIRTSNGYLWAGNVIGGAIRITRSIDGGGSWSPAVVTNIWASGITGMLGLWETGGNLIAFATANDGAGRNVRRISVGVPDITTGWITESLPVLPVPLTSDDHLSGDVLPDGRILVASKTTGSTTSGETLLYLLLRETNGNWGMTPFQGGPDDAGWSRGRVVITRDKVHIFYGSYQPNPSYDLVRKTANIDTPTSLGGMETILEGPDYSDSAVTPSAADILLGGDDYPVMAMNRYNGLITLMWYPSGDGGGGPGPGPGGITIRMKTASGVITLARIAVKGSNPIVRGAVRRGGVTVPLV